MSASDRYLVIGANGLIGDSLFRRWKGLGRDVHATSRRPNADGPDFLRLDLAENLENWTPPFPGGIAVLCAANANQEQCRRDPAGTRHINVIQTLKLAQRLLAQDFFLVFLSTNAVFDGEKLATAPSDPVRPMTEYGRQKAEVEAGLAQFAGCANELLPTSIPVALQEPRPTEVTVVGRRSCGAGPSEADLRPFAGRVAIVRLGKVVHPDLAIFRSWSESLAAGKAITPFSDYICSPIALELAVDPPIVSRFRGAYAPSRVVSGALAGYIFQRRS